MGSGKAITHQPCSDCGSSDGLTIYEDHSYCFVCEKHCWIKDKDQSNQYDRFVKKEKTVSTQELFPVDNLPFQNIRERGLTAETCQKFDYRVTGKGNHVASYRDAAGQVVGQKIRTVNPKGFSIKGNVQDFLYGMSLWGGGRAIVVTEGEVDALSYSQANDNRWPVVSIPSGAPSAKRAILKNLSYLLQFDKIIFCFDMDEPGRKAAKECAQIVPGGKAYIASLSMKDCNELLLAGRTTELQKIVWNAAQYTPDGIVTVKDLMDELLEPPKQGLPWAWEGLTELTRGRFPGSVLGLGGSTGCGKTDFLMQQMAFDMVVLGRNIGVFSFEQSGTDTVKRIASKLAKKRLHLPDAIQDGGKELMSYVDLFKDKLFLYDSYGSSDWSTVENNIKYLNECCNCDIFYIDNLTFIAESGNEKDSLEAAMKGMATLANDLQCIIIFVSHLSTPANGASHEEGSRVHGRDFKGSRVIMQLAFGLFGLERNQQEEDEWVRNTINFRVLKDRLTADGVGQCIKLHYDRDEGILNEVEDYLPFSIGE